jgi:hypothetical protein
MVFVYQNGALPDGTTCIVRSKNRYGRELPTDFDTIDKLLANDPKLKPLSLAFNSKLFMEKLHLAHTILQNVSTTLEWFESNEQQAAHMKMHLTKFVNRLAEALPEYFKNPCTGEREGFSDQAMAWAKGLRQAMMIKWRSLTKNFHYSAPLSVEKMSA